MVIVTSAGLSSDEPPLTIVAGGDTMLASWAEEPIRLHGYSYPYVHVKPVLDNADIVFTNLEAPFGQTGEAFDKQFTFQVKPDLVNVLLAGGINLVSLGNNHIMDFGPSSLKETMDILKSNQIHYAGAGLNLKEAREAARMEFRNKKVALLSYSLTFPQEFYATDSTAGTCFPWEEFVFSDVRNLKSEGNLVIISCHWGTELRENPKDYQIAFAHRLIDAGADLILGHHPHVIQGLEFYRGKLIAYSLGNFVFGSFSESVKESMLLRIKVNADDLQQVQVVPINVYNKEVEFQPIPLQGDQRSAFLSRLTRMSAELNSEGFVITDDGTVVTGTVVTGKS